MPLFRFTNRRLQRFNPFLALIYAHGVTWAAFVWRRLLFRTTFIGITGSVGKTTAKDCLGAILGAHTSTFVTKGTFNGRLGVPRMLVRVRPWHRFAVIEVGTEQVGMIPRAARLLRPHVAIVLAVAGVHRKGFASLEITADEKSKLIRSTAKHGSVVLNGDDEHVMKMETGERRVITFGTGPGSDVRGSDARAVWPERLQFQASDGERTVQVKTRFVGEHWIFSVLAAMAAGKLFGIDLQQSARAVAEIEPFTGRMQPVGLPCGAVVIRDANSSGHATNAAAGVMSRAKAERKWLVTGDCSDVGTNFRHRLRFLAEHAAKVFDHAVFVGEKSSYARRRAIEQGMAEERIHAFLFPEDAAAYLREHLRFGDLVLLKSQFSEHLERICFAQLGSVACWDVRCGKRMDCDNCARLGFRPDAR